MAGGSADAAAVLHGLNQMFRAGLPLEALVELGAKVGADVPFCVVGGACRCQGIGEQVEKGAPAARVLAGAVQAPRRDEHAPGLRPDRPVPAFAGESHGKKWFPCWLAGTCAALAKG